MHASLEYLHGLQRFGVVPGLERIERLMEGLGHPERDFASVHVAGTNGKGSVCCMVDAVLREAGLKVGLYTSPHMIDFRERIQVGGEHISKAALVELVDEVREVNEREGIGATFFEFVTAVAFLYFSRQGVEMAVVEVGMGGLLDATNVVNPEVAVVTNVGLDHTEFLGETKELIAREKAGVFKAGAYLVTGEREPGVLAILRGRARAVAGELVEARGAWPVTILEQGLLEQVVEVDGRQLRMKLVGEHQARNAEVGLAVVEGLRGRGWDISWEQVERGLSKAFWPGRLQVLGKNPLVMADSAHNEDGLVALGEFLETLSLPEVAVLLVGVKQGRDVTPLAERVAKYFDYVVVSAADFMAEEPGMAAAGLARAGAKKVEAIADRGQALERARERAGEAGAILVTGSIYFVGDVMREISKSK